MSINPCNFLVPEWNGTKFGAILYNVCSVHRGDIISISEGYLDYVGGYCDLCRGYHGFTGGGGGGGDVQYTWDIMFTSRWDVGG